MILCNKATWIPGVICLVLCAAQAQADQIPGSTIVVDPFTYEFDTAANGFYQITNNGIPVGGLVPSPGYSGPDGYLTFNLPALVADGDVGVVESGQIPPDRIALGDGIYLIPASQAVPSLFNEGLRFLTNRAGTQSSFQLYSGSSFPSNFGQAVEFGSHPYVIAVVGTPEPNGSVGFDYDIGAVLGVPDNIYFSPLALPPAVPEPRQYVAFLGLLGMGVVGMALRRKQGVLPLKPDSCLR